jgi:hypothetical protein
MTRISSICLAISLLVGASLGTTNPAHATGRFFADSADVTVTVRAHRILTVWRDGRATLTVQPVVESTGGDAAGRLGYILPVHGLPELAPADGAVFADLFDVSSPTVLTQKREPGDGCDGELLLLDEFFQPSVDAVVGTPSPDATPTILSPATAAAAESWLKAEGLAYTADDIAALEAELDGGARLVGVSFSRTGERTEPAPVAVSFFEPPDIRLPLALAAAAPATDGLAEVVIFVLHDKRFRILNYGSEDLVEVATGVRDQLAAGQAGDYDRVIDGTTARAGGRVFITEMALDLHADGIEPGAALAALMDDDISFLTRLHARTPAAALADAVVTFAKDGPEVAPEAVVPTGGVALGLGAGLLLALGFLRRRRLLGPSAPARAGA